MCDFFLLIVGLVAGILISIFIGLYMTSGMYSHSSLPRYKCVDNVLYISMNNEGPYVRKGHHCFNEDIKEE
jgi:hypothetical protein